MDESRFKKIVILGDSIVWGAADLQKGGWPNRLISYFRKNKSAVKIYSKGIIGNDTGKLINDFDEEVKNQNPDVIIFAIGINDAQITNGQSRISLKQFEQDLILLISMAKKFAPKVIFIGLSRVSDRSSKSVWWSRDKSYDNNVIEKYDSELKMIAGKHSCDYIPVSDIFENDELLWDGIHPNSKGHQKMSERIGLFLSNKKLWQ